MTDGIIVLVCALVFTASMAWLNTKSSHHAPFMRWLTYFFTLAGAIMALVCLVILFNKFITEV